MEGTFGAETQYNDWTGSAAADDIDKGTLRNLLRERGLLGDDEFLVAVELTVAENHPGRLATPIVTCSKVVANNFDEARTLIHTSDPVPVVRFEVSLSLEEFVGLFKRFEVALFWKQLPLDGKDFTAPD